MISDLHAPFHHPGAVEFLRGVCREYRPQRIVCLGDEIDLASASRFPKEPDSPSPDGEIELAREALKPIFKLFPHVSVCTSNHAARAAKRAKESSIPTQFVRSVRDVIGAPPGWQWRDWWRIDGVIYCHGEGFSGANAARTAAEKYRASTVIGHVHAFAGVQWIAAPMAPLIFGMNCGCLVDIDSPAMRYGRWLSTRPVIGTGMVIDGLPQFVPMEYRK